MPQSVLSQRMPLLWTLTSKSQAMVCVHVYYVCVLCTHQTLTSHLIHILEETIDKAVWEERHGKVRLVEDGVDR